MTLSHVGRHAPKFEVVAISSTGRYERSHSSERHTLARRTLIVAAELVVAWGLVGLAANLYVRFGG